MPKCTGCGQALAVTDYGEDKQYWCWLCWKPKREQENNEFLQAEKERKEKKHDKGRGR